MRKKRIGIVNFVVTTMIAYQYKIRQQQAFNEKISPVVNPSLTNSEIRKITIAEAAPIILQYEWLRKMPGFSRVAFGHYFLGILGGVLLFGHTTGSDIAFTKMFPGKKVIVLQRGVHLWWTPPNSASWLISRACKQLRIDGFDIVTATADEEAGEIGTIYQALNWSYLGTPKHGHPVFIIDGAEVHPKTLYDKHGTSSVFKIQQIYGNRVKILPRLFKRRYAFSLIPRFKIMSLSYPKRTNES